MDYKFKRSYHAPAYWVLFSTTSIVAIGFLSQAFTSTTILVLGLLLGAVSVGLFVSIMRRDTSGVIVSQETATFWLGQMSKNQRNVQLSDILHLSYHRFDAEKLIVELKDGKTFTLDERYFGNICELIAALQLRCPHLTATCLSGPPCS